MNDSATPNHAHVGQPAAASPDRDHAIGEAAALMVAARGLIGDTRLLADLDPDGRWQLQAKGRLARASRLLASAGIALAVGSTVTLSGPSAQAAVVHAPPVIRAVIAGPTVTVAVKVRTSATGDNGLHAASLWAPVVGDTIRVFGNRVRSATVPIVGGVPSDELAVGRSVWKVRDDADGSPSVPILVDARAKVRITPQRVADLGGGWVYAAAVVHRYSPTRQRWIPYAGARVEVQRAHPKGWSTRRVAVTNRSGRVEVLAEWLYGPSLVRFATGDSRGTWAGASTPRAVMVHQGPPIE